MSNTEVVGWIRVADDKPWTPVVANLAGICPCFLRHGGVCRSPRHRGVCDSTPKAGEACFKSKNSVSTCCFVQAYLAADYSSADAERCTSRSLAVIIMTTGCAITRIANKGMTFRGRLCALERVTSTRIIIPDSELVLLSCVCCAPSEYN